MILYIFHDSDIQWLIKIHLQSNTQLWHLHIVRVSQVHPRILQSLKGVSWALYDINN